MLFHPAPALATLGLVSMMTVLSGCSGSDAQNDAHKGRAVVETESGLKVLVAGPTNGSGQARVVGKLAEVEGCLGIRLGENRWVALFLSGAKVSTDGEVTLPEGSPLNVGDSIEGGGSFYDNRTPDFAPKLSDVCNGVGETVVSDVTS